MLVFPGLNCSVVFVSQDDTIAAITGIEPQSTKFLKFLDMGHLQIFCMTKEWSTSSSLDKPVIVILTKTLCKKNRS